MDQASIVALVGIKGISRKEEVTLYVDRTSSKITGVSNRRYDLLIGQILSRPTEADLEEDHNNRPTIDLSIVFEVKVKNYTEC